MHPLDWNLQSKIPKKTFTKSYDKRYTEYTEYVMNIYWIFTEYTEHTEYILNIYWMYWKVHWIFTNFANISMSQYPKLI